MAPSLQVQQCWASCRWERAWCKRTLFIEFISRLDGWKKSSGQSRNLQLDQVLRTSVFSLALLGLHFLLADFFHPSVNVEKAHWGVRSLLRSIAVLSLVWKITEMQFCPLESKRPSLCNPWWHMSPFKAATSTWQPCPKSYHPEKEGRKCQNVFQGAFLRATLHSH